MTYQDAEEFSAFFRQKDRERVLCHDAVRIGTFGEKLNKLNHSELESLLDMFHHVVTLFLNGIDCEGDEFRKKSALVKTAFDELLAKRAKAA